MTRKELTRDLRNLRGEEKKSEERERQREEAEGRLQEQRKTLDRAIAQEMKTAEKRTNKAPQPPAPTKTKAPTGNITQGKQLEVPPKSPTRSVKIEEDSGCSSEGEHENHVAGPIDLTKPEQVTGPHIRTKLAISGEKDILERARYIEKQGRSQTFNIICGPAKLG